MRYFRPSIRPLLVQVSNYQKRKVVVLVGGGSLHDRVEEVDVSIVHEKVTMPDKGQV